MLKLNSVRDSAPNWPPTSTPSAGAPPAADAAQTASTPSPPTAAHATAPALGPAERLREIFPPALGQRAMSADQAADAVTQLFRKSLAADAYHRMFSQGSCFAKIGYQPRNRRKHPESLTMMATLSRRNLAALDGILHDLSRREERFLKNLMNSPWNFRHQTDATVFFCRKPGSAEISTVNTLTIYSSHQLQQKKIQLSERTKDGDRIELANDDFVFFGVEFTDDSKQQKINSDTFGGFSYGKFAYVMPETDPRAQFGYLTLTDHYEDQLKMWQRMPECKKWPESSRPMLEQVLLELGKLDATDPVTGKSTMFSFEDMKKGLGLSVIDFLRKANVPAFQNWAYSQTSSNDESMHRVLNLIFQPEFHIPKLWSSATASAIRAPAEASEASEID